MKRNGWWKNPLLFYKFLNYICTLNKWNMKHIFLSISILFFYQFVFAQVNQLPEDSLTNQYIIQNGNESQSLFQNLDVNQDPRMEKFLNWQIEENREKNGMDGYRVEIFFSSDLDGREKAEQKKVEFLSKYPDYNVYVKFIAPNFRVRVGDFRTKSEAWKLYKKIERNYRAAFVVKDNINFPMLKQVNYE